MGADRLRDKDPERDRGDLAYPAERGQQEAAGLSGQGLRVLAEHGGHLLQLRQVSV